MTTLREEVWAKIRNEYVNTEETIEKIAKKHLITPKRLLEHARANKWPPRQCFQPTTHISQCETSESGDGLKVENGDRSGHSHFGKIDEETTKDRKPRPKSNISTDVEICDAVEVDKDSILSDHRQDIRFARQLVNGLLNEVATYGTHRDQVNEIERLLIEAKQQKQNGEWGGAMSTQLTTDMMNVTARVMSLNNRTAVVEKLANALTKVVDLERKAIGIDTKQGDDGNQVVTVINIQI